MSMRASSRQDENPRIMPVSGNGFEQCYNAQAVVAADSLLVVCTDVVQASTGSLASRPLRLCAARTKGPDTRSGHGASTEDAGRGSRVSLLMAGVVASDPAGGWSRYPNPGALSVAYTTPASDAAMHVNNTGRGSPDLSYQPPMLYCLEMSGVGLTATRALAQPSPVRSATALPSAFLLPMAVPTGPLPMLDFNMRRKFPAGSMLPVTELTPLASR